MQHFVIKYIFHLSSNERQEPIASALQRCLRSLAHENIGPHSYTAPHAGQRRCRIAMQHNKPIGKHTMANNMPRHVKSSSSMPTCINRWLDPVYSHISAYSARRAATDDDHLRLLWLQNNRASIVRKAMMRRRRNPISRRRASESRRILRHSRLIQYRRRHRNACVGRVIAGRCCAEKNEITQ